MVTFMNIVQSVGALISGQGGALAFLSQLHEFAPSLRGDFYTTRSPCPQFPLPTFPTTGVDNADSSLVTEPDISIYCQHKINKNKKGHQASALVAIVLSA